MYVYNDPTTAKNLISKLKDLQECNNQIALGENAKGRKLELMKEIGELYRQLAEEEQDEF